MRVYYQQEFFRVPPAKPAELTDHQNSQIKHAKAVLREQGAALAWRDNWRTRLSRQSLAENADILTKEICAPFGKRVSRVLDRMRQIDERTPAQRLQTQADNNSGGHEQRVRELIRALPGMPSDSGTSSGSAAAAPPLE